MNNNKMVDCKCVTPKTRHEVCKWLQSINPLYNLTSIDAQHGSEYDYFLAFDAVDLLEQSNILLLKNGDFLVCDFDGQIHVVTESLMSALQWLNK